MDIRTSTKRTKKALQALADALTREDGPTNEEVIDAMGFLALHELQVAQDFGEDDASRACAKIVAAVTDFFEAVSAEKTVVGAHEGTASVGTEVGVALVTMTEQLTDGGALV